jgi:DNA polymerase II small subunit
MINASTWQSQTDYQKQHNLNPNPGVMPVVHLGTGKMTMMEFAKD